MSVASAPFYWVVCDGCGERHDYGEYIAWAEVEQAYDAAGDANDGWWLLRYELPIVGHVDLCFKCRPLIGDNDEWAPE